MPAVTLAPVLVVAAVSLLVPVEGALLGAEVVAGAEAPAAGSGAVVDGGVAPVWAGACAKAGAARQRDAARAAKLRVFVIKCSQSGFPAP
jgi:hypothetical protein